MERPWGYSLHHPSAAGTFNTNHGETRKSRRPLQQMAISEREELEGTATSAAIAASALHSAGSAVAAASGSKKRLGRAAHRQFGSFLMASNTPAETGRPPGPMDSLAHVQQLLWEDDGSSPSDPSLVPVPSVTTAHGTFVSPQPFVRPIDPHQRERLQRRVDLLPPTVQPHPLSREANDPLAMRGLSRSRHMSPNNGASVHLRFPAQYHELDAETELPLSPLSPDTDADHDPLQEGLSAAELAARRFPIHMTTRGQQLQSELLALIRPLAGKGPAQISPDTVARMQLLSRELRAANSSAILDGESGGGHGAGVGAAGNDDDDALYPASLRALAMQSPLTSFESATGPLLELLAPHVQSALSALSIASRKRREQLESQRPWHHAAAFHPPRQLEQLAEEARDAARRRALDDEAAAAAEARVHHPEEKQRSPRREGGSVSPSRRTAAPTALPSVDPAYATSRSLSLAQSLTACGSGAPSKWSRKGALVSPRDSHRIPYQSARTSHSRSGRVERVDSRMPLQAPLAQPQLRQDCAGGDDDGAPALERPVVHSQLFVNDVPAAALMRAGLAHADDAISDRVRADRHRLPGAPTAPDALDGWSSRSPGSSRPATSMAAPSMFPVAPSSDPSSSSSSAAAATAAAAAVLPFPTRTGSREGLRSRPRSRSHSPDRAASSRSHPLVTCKADQFLNRSRPRSREVSPARGPALTAAALADTFPAGVGVTSAAIAGAPTCPPARPTSTVLARKAPRDDAFLVALLDELMGDVAAWKEQQRQGELEELRRARREQAQLMFLQSQEEKQEQPSDLGTEIAPVSPFVSEDAAPSLPAEPLPTPNPPTDAPADSEASPPASGVPPPPPPRPPSPPRLASARTVANLFDALLAAPTADAEHVATAATAAAAAAASRQPDVLSIDRSHPDAANADAAASQTTTTVRSGASLSLEVSGRVTEQADGSDHVAAALRAAAAASETNDEGPAMAAATAVTPVVSEAPRPVTSRRPLYIGRSSKSLLRHNSSRRDVGVALSSSSSAALPASSPSPPAVAVAETSSARLVAGVTAINRRRTTTAEHKRTFLALRFTPPAPSATAAADGSPAPDQPRAPTVIDLAAETEKLRWWEQRRAALQRRDSENRSSSDTGVSDPGQRGDDAQSGFTSVHGADEPDLSSLRLPPVDDPVSARLPGSASQGEIQSARGQRSYTHSIITPHTQSKLVALLTQAQAQQQLQLQQRGSQSARAVLQHNGRDRLVAPRTILRSGNIAFTRSFVPVTAAAALMQPRAPTPPSEADASAHCSAVQPAAEALQQCDAADPTSSSSTALPTSLPSSPATAALHGELLSLLASRPRSLLLLRRLANELVEARSTDGHASAAPYQLRRRLIPRLESRLAVQLQSLRQHTASITRTLDRWAAANPLQPVFVHHQTDVRAQMRIEMEYFGRMQMQLLTPDA